MRSSAERKAEKHAKSRFAYIDQLAKDYLPGGRYRSLDVDPTSFQGHAHDARLQLAYAAAELHYVREPGTDPIDAQLTLEVVVKRLLNALGHTLKLAEGETGITPEVEAMLASLPAKEDA